ncbi:MAG TPA: hypothetical protein VK635_14635 [Bradyrhizobium sp.]|jgi:hypothetical protein|nr:hypothetical protein [Bradyrhizobium sp.]
MDYGVLDAVTVELLAAYALHQRTWFLRRQFFAGLPHRMFSSGPILLVTPRLKVSLGSCQKTRHAFSKSARASAKLAAVSL